MHRLIVFTKPASEDKLTRLVAEGQKGGESQERYFDLTQPEADYVKLAREVFEAETVHIF